MQGSEQQYNNLLAELSQAKELVIQLEAHFNGNSSEFGKTLTPKILSSIENSILMACSFHPANHVYCSGKVDYPQSAGNSPCSANSDQPFKVQGPGEMSKKRKTLPKWTSQFRLGAYAGATEGLVDDGFSWRKYGQKDILGAKYPRGYYRCTHQKTQGCVATKQVQRSDEDPNVFDITYHGAHTCSSRNQLTTASARRGNQQKQSHQGIHQQSVRVDSDLLLSFQTGLQVKTEGLLCETEQNDSASFVFESRPVAGTIPGDLFGEDSVMRSSWPTFFSPTTSESTYFSASPCGMKSLELEHDKLQTWESDVAEMISTPMSSCSSTIMDLDFMLDLCTDLNLEEIDTSSFFS